MTPDELAALEASWPKCDYWTLRDGPDDLTHRSVVAALELDSLRGPADAIDWFLRWKRGGGTLTVYGYTRKRVTDADIDSMVDHLTDAFHEYWIDGLELGNPDDEPEPPAIRLLHAVIAKDMRTRHVWQCDQTHRVTLTVDAVIAIARRARPELVERSA